MTTKSKCLCFCQLYAAIVLAAVLGKATGFVQLTRSLVSVTSSQRPDVEHKFSRRPRTSVKSVKRNENLEAENLAASSQQQQLQNESWSDAIIISSHYACPSRKSMVVNVQVNAKTCQEYTRPGQFVQFAFQDKNPIFLAMASPPHRTTSANSVDEDRGVFEFLIKLSPRLEWLTEALIEGQTVQVSAVMGDGFPLHVFRTPATKTTILMAAA